MFLIKGINYNSHKKYQPFYLIIIYLINYFDEFLIIIDLFQRNFIT